MATEATERTYSTIDKSEWPRGPWDSEPDKVQWIDEASGLDCLAVRNGSIGHWCGYVGVPEGHPAFGIDEEKIEPDVEVHGGLTFAAFCQDGKEEEAICHVPFAGRPEKVWWLGFDCAHAGDLLPRHSELRDRAELRDRDYNQYRTLGFIRTQCAELARQLVAMGKSK